MTTDDRIPCGVCTRPIPEGDRLYDATLGLLVHHQSCAALIEQYRYDYARSVRGRHRTRADIVRLVRLHLAGTPSGVPIVRPEPEPPRPAPEPEASDAPGLSCEVQPRDRVGREVHCLRCARPFRLQRAALIVRMGGEEIGQIGYTCGCMHPEGRAYIAAKILELEQTGKMQP